MNKHNDTILSPEVRRQQIVQLLEQQGECSVEYFVETFKVSGMTIRRDLQELADAGRVLRTHGGAACSARVSFEFRFLARAKQQADSKAAIAKVAAGLVKPGNCVLLDSSTTTLAIARELKAICGITVITTSLPIASELFGIDSVEVLLLGGVLRKGSPDLIGAITNNNLGMLHSDIAFLGADAIDEKGDIYNASPEVGQMLKCMSEAADCVYAVADHTKLGQTSLMRFANIKTWQGLICDRQIKPSIKQQFKKIGIKIFQPTK